MRPPFFKMRWARGNGALGMDRVMQRLTENREVDRVLVDRRILDVAEAVFEILETVLLRQLRSELDHLRRVIDRDDFARVFGEQLRERSLARAEIGHGQRRQQRDQRMRERLPGAARAHNCGRICPPAGRNIRALCPAVCAGPA